MAQKASPYAVEKAVKEQRALDLRIARASYSRIGEELGMTEAGAHKLVQRSLARVQAKSAEEAQDVLAIELLTLDRMQLGLAPAAFKGNQAAVDRVLRIMERRAKYLALDAPSRHEFTGKGGGPMEIHEAPGQLSDEELREQGERILAKYRGDDGAGASDPAGD